MEASIWGLIPKEEKKRKCKDLELQREEESQWSILTYGLIDAMVLQKEVLSMALSFVYM